MKFSDSELVAIQRACDIAAKQYDADAADFDKEPGHAGIAQSVRDCAIVCRQIATRIENEA